MKESAVRGREDVGGVLRLESKLCLLEDKLTCIFSCFLFLIDLSSVRVLHYAHEHPHVKSKEMQ